MKPPSRDELWDLYKIALDEYRFQVNLNWQRLNYYLGLNVALTGGAAGLLLSDASRPFPVVAFALGAGTAVLAWFTDRVARGYYVAARERKADLETRLGLGVFAIDTTPGMGGARRHWKVRTFHDVLFVAMFLLNTAGASYTLASRS